MQPVAHIADYYAHQIERLQPVPLKTSWLYQGLLLYRKLAVRRP